MSRIYTREEFLALIAKGLPDRFEVYDVKSSGFRKAIREPMRGDSMFETFRPGPLNLSVSFSLTEQERYPFRPDPACAFDEPGELPVVPGSLFSVSRSQPPEPRDCASES